MNNLHIVRDSKKDWNTTSAEGSVECPIRVVSFQLNGFHEDKGTEGQEDLQALWESLP